MITVGMNYSVLEGKEQAFESMFFKVLELMSTMEGHQNSQLFKEVRQPRNYLIISEWDDETAFTAFIQSDRFKDVATWGKEQILSARPKHEIYKSQTTSPGTA